MDTLDRTFAILFSTSIVLYGVVIYYIWNILNRHKDVINSEKFSRKKKLRMFYNLIIRTADIRNMTFLLTILALFSFLNFVFLGKFLYDEIPDYYLIIAGGISLFVAGFTGYVQYFREEMPWRLSVERGWLAKTSGIALMIIFWSFSAFAIIYGIINWLS